MLNPLGWNRWCSFNVRTILSRDCCVLPSYQLDCWNTHCHLMTPRKPPRAVAIHLTGAIWNFESPATQLFRPWCVTGCWNSGDFETEREKSLVYISCNWVPKFQLGCVSWSDTFILAAICELWLDCLTWTELKWTDRRDSLCANLPRRCFGILRRWQFATSLHLVEWAAWTTSSVIHLQILRNGTSMWIGLHRAADSAVAVWM